MHLVEDNKSAAYECVGRVSVGPRLPQESVKPLRSAHQYVPVPRRSVQSVTTPEVLDLMVEWGQVPGELACDLDDRLAWHAGDLFGPGRGKGEIIVKALGDIAAAEAAMQKLNDEKTRLETMLIAEDFYARTPQEQVTATLREQARLAQALETAENEWLALQEELEALNA